MPRGGDSGGRVDPGVCDFKIPTGNSQTVLRNTEKCYNITPCFREEWGEDFVPEKCQVSSGTVAPSEP